MKKKESINYMSYTLIILKTEIRTHGCQIEEEILAHRILSFKLLLLGCYDERQLHPI